MNKRQLQLCLSFMKGNLSLYALAVVCMLIAVGISFVTPRILGWTIDSFIGDKPLAAPEFIKSAVESLGGRTVLVQNLWICGAALVIFSILNGLLSFIQSRSMALASERISEKMRNRLYSHIQSLSYNYHVKVETGDLLQRCSSDVETVRRFLSSQLVQIVRSVAFLAVALTLMIPMSLSMTGVAIALVPFIFWFSMVYFKRAIAKWRDSEEAEGALSACLQENLTGMRVVRAFGRQLFEIEKFDQRSSAFRDKAFKAGNLMAIYWGSSDGIVVVQRAALLFYGIYLAVLGNITVGTLTVFMSYQGMMLWPVRQLGRVLADMGRAMVAFERIDQVLREQPETEEEGKVCPPLDGDIVFDNVEFAYETGKPVLNGVSFTAKKGKTIALLGSTGSGKSTMMHLLQRLYDYQGGSITINGAELSTIDKKHLRSKVGIVLQEPFLYSKPVRENIAIIDPSMPDEAVFEAAKTASVHDVILGFEKGYETLVGERGVTLSGGQKQRVSIARTLLKDNDILIFDDSLSAVDTETDAAIRDALSARGGGTTTFIIAHRVTTLMQADLILVLEGGKIAQSGNHAELVSQDGLYRRIFTIQTELEEEFEKENDSETAQGGVSVGTV